MDDVRTCSVKGWRAYTVEAHLGENGTVCAREQARRKVAIPKVLAKIEAPFQSNGGLKMLHGNMGKGVIKISAVKPERHVIESHCRGLSTISRNCRMLSNGAS